MAERSEYAKRFGTLFLAALFLFTSAGVTIFAIWQSNNTNEDDLALQQFDDSTDQFNQQIGENMLQGKPLADFTPTSDQVKELQIIDLVEGTGTEAKADSTVTAHYTGALVANGIVFQSSLDSGEPFTSPLSNLIVGWQEGIPGMKVGGKRRLIIPYEKAYGEAGSPPAIPEKADLVFDIELLGVE